MRNLLLLLPSTSFRASTFLKSIEKIEGISFAIGTDKPSAIPGLEKYPFITLPFEDMEIESEEILRFSREFPLDALVPVDEQALLLTAVASEKLGLPFHSPDAVLMGRDKYAFREKVKEAGILQPEYRLIPMPCNFREYDDKLSYPCMVKPLSLFGGMGVYQAEDYKEYGKAFRSIMRFLIRIENSHKITRTHLLIEDFIPGKRIVIEGVVEKSSLQELAFFKRISTGENLYGVNPDHFITISPEELSPAEKEQALQALQSALKPLGFHHGPIHGEVVLNEKGAWLLKLSARAIYSLVCQPLKFGEMTIEEVVIRSTLGLEISPFEPPGEFWGVKPLYSMENGSFFGEKLISSVAYEEIKKMDFPDSLKVPAPKTSPLNKEESGSESGWLLPDQWQDLTAFPEGNRYRGYYYVKRGSAKEALAALKEPVEGKKIEHRMRITYHPKSEEIRQYFPPVFEFSWASHFFDLFEVFQESSVYAKIEDSEIFRLLYDPSFTPAQVLVLEKIGDNFFLKGKRLNEWVSGYGIGQEHMLEKEGVIALDQSLWDEWLSKLDKISFWEMPAEVRQLGCDGTNYLLEGRLKNHYHLVYRWSPEGAFNDLCCFLMDLGSQHFSWIKRDSWE